MKPVKQAEKFIFLFRVIEPLVFFSKQFQKLPYAEIANYRLRSSYVDVNVMMLWDYRKTWI